MFCKNCGKEIDDNVAVCPHCGVLEKTLSSSNNNSQSSENAIAIIGFVYSFLFQLAGLICSIIGFRKAVKEGAPYKWLSLAGIIISCIMMVVGCVIGMAIVGWL